MVFDNANDYSDVIAASHVSQHWRFSAHSHRLYAVGLIIWALHGEDVTSILQRGIHRLESAPLPLDFHLSIDFTDWDTSHRLLWNELVVALARAMTRPGVRRMTLYINGVQLDTALDRLRDTPAPLLESLTLVSQSVQAISPLERLFTGYAPVLRDVAFSGVAINSITDSTAFANVQQMEIMSDSIDLVIALSACPVLQRLTLRNGELKLNIASTSNSAYLGVGHSLQKLVFDSVSWSTSDEALTAVFRAIMLPNIPTVRWSSDIAPPTVVFQELLHGLPPQGLSLALTRYEDLPDILNMRLGVLGTNMASSSLLSGDVEACVRDFVFTSPSEFTLWPWVGTHRIAYLRISHPLLFTILPKIPSFCLPQLLVMHIGIPSGVVDFWDPQNDLASGRLLAPRLRRLTLFATHAEKTVVAVTGLVCLATQVLGLSLVGADLPVSGSIRPDLHLVNLMINEQEEELPRLFGRIDFEETDVAGP